MFANTEKETYTFDVTHKTPEWGKALTKQLTEYFGNISKQLSSVDANCLSIRKQIADFKTKVKNDIQKVDQKATEALDATIANKVAITANEVTMRRLERELVAVNRKCNVLEFENERLTAQNESQEFLLQKAIRLVIMVGGAIKAVKKVLKQRHFLPGDFQQGSLASMQF